MLGSGWGRAFATITALAAMALVLPLASVAAGIAPIGPSSTPMPMPTPTPRGTVLFEDDFATYSRRWREQKSPKASVVYRDSALNVRVVSPGVSAWSIPDFATRLEEYSMPVTATLNGGSPDALFGFVMDFQDDQHFYALMVTREGEWRLAQHEGNAWIDLAPSDPVSVKRELDATTIRLRVDVTGEIFTVFADDRLVTTVTVDKGEAPGSTFGLIAQAGRGFVDVSFDEMVVTGPLKADRP